MGIQKLEELAREYSLSDQLVDQRVNDRLSFIEKFPLTKLKDLSIDQFVQGTDDNSFCYWLEFKKIGFGIGGGNASKFGIYKTKNGEEIVYATGYGKNKTFLDDQAAQVYFSDLLSKILKALDFTRSDKIEKIKELEIPMWNMVLQKILAIYFPDKFLTIGAPTVLIKCAKELELQNIELSSDNSILINYECKKAISKNQPFSEWSYEKIGTFIWETFDGEDHKRKVKESKQYWLYAPGENARNWDEFYFDGIMALGWDEIGDLKQYTSRDQIKKALVAAYGGDGSKKNDVSANDDFINKINIGDIVITKKGRGELLGYGVVISDYTFDENRHEYKHVRKVDWKLKGNWKVDFNLVLKTLTDITKYRSDHPDYDNYYERLLGIMGIGNPKKDSKEIPLSAKVIYAYLKNSLSHRKIQSEVLGEDSPARGGGFLAMQILHNYEIEGDKKGILNKTPFHIEFDKAEGKYLEALNLLKKYYPELIEGTEKNNNMMFPLNTILYGPPGTGKTYNTVLRAAEIVEDRKIDSYDDALDIFKANLHDQIEFITFHQNYSYEDFIQGLRPDTTNDSNLLFEKKDGVFKRIADRAKKDSYFVPVGTKLKDYTVIKSNRDIVELWSERTKSIRYVPFQLIKDLMDGITGKRINLEDIKKRRDLDLPSLLKSKVEKYYFGIEGTLYNICEFLIETQAKNNKLNYVLIIDEINRANISRVFGELITLIEPDKRSNGKIPMEAKLPSGDPFIVPSNLYIIGTMNTADKSIALLDIALRRRFEFEAMYPKYEIEGQEIYDVDILKNINQQIVKSKGHDFQIGHAYFMGENNDLVSRMNKKVIPLLLEYYMNDEKEVKVLLESSGLTIEENSWPLRITGRND